MSPVVNVVFKIIDLEKNNKIICNTYNQIHFFRMANTR